MEIPVNCSITNTNVALSSGTDTFQFNLTNTSQPFDVWIISLFNEQVTKESGGDVVTSLCYTPTKYFAAGMSNGLVHVKYFLYGMILYYYIVLKIVKMERIYDSEWDEKMVISILVLA